MTLSSVHITYHYLSCFTQSNLDTMFCHQATYYKAHSWLFFINWDTGQSERCQGGYIDKKKVTCIILLYAQWHISTIISMMISYERPMQTLLIFIPPWIVYDILWYIHEVYTKYLNYHLVLELNCRPMPGVSLNARLRWVT